MNLPKIHIHVLSVIFGKNRYSKQASIEQLFRKKMSEDDTKGNLDIPTSDTLSSTLKVLFIHGGGYRVNRDLSQQPFAKYLESHFENTHIENMKNTSLFEQCIRQQTKAIIEYKPHLIVCKSQGGPTLFQLLHRGIWRGPSVLCCPAIVPGIDDTKFVNDVPFLVVSGSKDVAVPLSRIDHIMEVNKQFVQNNTVDKCIVDDDHGLLTLLDDEKCVEDNLYNQIDKCWNMYLNMDINERRPIHKFATDKMPQYEDNTENNTDWFRKSKKNQGNDNESDSCSCIIL